MRYLIVGAGGVGGAIASFLALSGHVVTCIVRGKHKENMLSAGLKLHSGIHGERTIPCSPYTEEAVAAHEAQAVRPPRLFVSEADAFTGRADRIFVTVKGYSIDSVAPCIVRAAGPGSIVLPVLNVWGTGPRIARACPGVRVIDGCIYILAYVNAPGEVTQMGRVFRLVFGARPADGVQKEELCELESVLRATGMKAECSDDINRDTFAKWGFISAMACTGAYFDIPMGPIQQPGPERDVFIGLTRESTALGEAMGIDFGYDVVERNLAVLDSLAPDSTASLQKDLARGHESEIQGQLFDLLNACLSHGVAAPTYERVARKFEKYRA